MEVLRTLLPFQQQPGRRRWGLPAQNAAAIGSNPSSSSPVFSFFNGGGRGGSVLPGGGVLGGEGDVGGDLSRNPVRSGGKAVVGDSAVVLNKASLSKDSVPSSHPLKNTKATDYATPEKYLENPEKIPSYYVFQSNMVTDEDLKPGMLRNLEVDKRLTLPTRTHIRFLITATDVIHSWAVPALGIKADAIPGRMQKVTTFIQREGVFYGQCSELCGSLHGFMPIVVEAVSPETYAAHAKKWYRDE